MERQAAIDEASRRGREEPPGSDIHWSVREAEPGDWEVVRFTAPGRTRPALKPVVGTKPYRPDPGELQPPVHRTEWGSV